MDWNVKNALSADVERQHLNKILAEIAAAVAALQKKASASQTSIPDNNIKSLVGEMVQGNTEQGIAVSYDAINKVLNFAVSNFTLGLTGDVTGSGTLTPGASATIEVTINPDKIGIREVPNDGSAYWRRWGLWEQVGNNLEEIAALQASGILTASYDPVLELSTWNMRTLQQPAAGITITNPDGAAGDPTFALADDLAAVEALATTGLAARTAANTWATRTITAGAGISVSNGDGVAGNPTVTHADTSSVADFVSNNSNLVVIQDLTVSFDTFGHVQTIAVNTLDLATSLITQTITSGDTTHAPSGNAVFDALALKEPAVTAGTTGQMWRGDKVFSNNVVGPWVIGTISNSLSFAHSLRVEFEDTVAVPSATFIRYGNNVSSAFVLGYKTRGTAAAPTQALANDALMAIRAGGWHSGGAFGSTQAAEIVLRAAENFTSTAQGTKVAIRTTATGTTSTADRLTIESNGDVVVESGRLYGMALHNNASALTGTTNQYVGSGTYTPTYTNVANVSATTASTAQWLRVGNVVTVSGRLNVATTAAAPTVTQLRMSLPIASAFAGVHQCAGQGGRQSAGAIEPISINADTVNDEALLTFYATATASVGTTFQFSYIVI
jgi:hypothetical protein